MALMVRTHVLLWILIATPCASSSIASVTREFKQDLVGLLNQMGREIYPRSFYHVEPKLDKVSDSFDELAAELVGLEGVDPLGLTGMLLGVAAILIGAGGFYYMYKEIQSLKKQFWEMKAHMAEEILKVPAATADLEPNCVPAPEIV